LLGAVRLLPLGAVGLIDPLSAADSWLLVVGVVLVVAGVLLVLAGVVAGALEVVCVVEVVEVAVWPVALAVCVEVESVVPVECAPPLPQALSRSASTPAAQAARAV